MSSISLPILKLGMATRYSERAHHSEILPRFSEREGALISTTCFFSIPVRSNWERNALQDSHHPTHGNRGWFKSILQPPRGAGNNRDLGNVPPHPCSDSCTVMPVIAVYEETTYGMLSRQMPLRYRIPWISDYLPRGENKIVMRNSGKGKKNHV
jgi:hypothetical protein